MGRLGKTPHQSEISATGGVIDELLDQRLPSLFSASDDQESGAPRIESVNDSWSLNAIDDW